MSELVLKSYNISKLIKGKGVNTEYFIPPEWVDKEYKTRYISISFEGGWVTQYSLNRVLLIVSEGKYDIRDWYDRWILGITVPSQRPKCPYCNKEVEFTYHISNGYRLFCSCSCRAKYNLTLLWNDPNSSYNSEDYSSKLSNSIKLAHQNPDSKYHDIEYQRSLINNITGKYEHGYYESIKGGLCCYRSSWELQYIKFLDDNDECLEFKSEPLRLRYKWDDDTTHYYVPDFLVTYKSGIELIEIKPSSQIDDEVNQWKFNAARLYCNKLGWKFKIITENELFTNIT